MEEIFKKIKSLLLGGALLFAIFGILPATAQAATLYFSPSSGSHAVGASFIVSVYVSSADQEMNGASGVVSFPTDKLSVESLSKNGSIFSLWAQEPSFSNSAGTINFEGIVFNPGFTGSSGKIISVTFRVKTAGTANLGFPSGSVLANDGKGTNILASLGTASFAAGFTGSSAPEATTPSEAIGTPSAPQISSPTHPDPNKWYVASDAKFTWSLPSDVTAARLLVGKIPQAIPTVYYSPAINSKELSDLSDGVWYFHVRLKNASGWGGVSHFRLQIDSQPPEPFKIKFVDGNETENPRPTVLFDTVDSLSGIDYYKVKIGEGDFFPVSSEIVKSNPYTLPLQAPGKRTILVQAFDKAGNYTTDVEEFVIKALEAPIITDYPKELQSGQALTIKGKTKYSDAQITLWLQHEKDDPQNYSAKSDQDGKFTLVADGGLSGGVYTAWAEVADSRGAKSDSSEKITISVVHPALIRIGSQAVGYLAVIIPLIILIFALLFIIWYGWHKFGAFRKKLGKIKKEVREAKPALHKAFDLLKNDIREQIKLLEKTRTKRQLTEEEEKIIGKLKKDLDDAEKFVRKEIKDIEKVAK